VARVEVDLWPTAYRFASGHRLRLQVAGGAFPRWDRNAGTDDPPGTATTLRPREQCVSHDPDRPSRITLSTVE